MESSTVDFQWFLNTISQGKLIRTTEKKMPYNSTKYPGFGSGGATKINFDTHNIKVFFKKWFFRPDGGRH